MKKILKGFITFWSIIIILNRPVLAQVVTSPIYIQGKKKKQDPSVVKPPTSVQGIGAKKIDPPKNDFGLDLDLLDKQKDISLERRRTFNKLGPTLRISVGLENYIQVQDLKLGKGLSTRILLKKKNENIKYTDPGKSAVKTSDDSKKKILKKQRDIFAQLDYRPSFSQKLHFRYQFDQQKVDRIFFYRNVGIERGNRSELDFSCKLTNFLELKGSGITYKNSFQPKVTQFFSNTSKGNKWSPFVSFKISDTQVTALYLNQNLSRSIGTGEKVASFERKGTQLEFQSKAKIFVEMELFAKAQVFQDQVNNQASLNHKSLNLAANLSSPTDYRYGLKSLNRYYQIIPKISHLFGDGIALNGNEKLPLQKGFRIGAGPWIKIGPVKAESIFYGERELNSPYLVSDTPYSAKALSISGTWARGINSIVKAKLGQFKMALNYQWQQVLNNSRISWQHGRPVPFRPEHFASLNMSYSYKRWKFMSHYHYTGPQFMDLVGSIQLPPQHSWGPSASYQANNWKIRIDAKNLWSRYGQVEAPFFNGHQTQFLYSPANPSPHIQLLWEYLL